MGRFRAYVGKTLEFGKECEMGIYRFGFAEVVFAIHCKDRCEAYCRLVRLGEYEFVEESGDEKSGMLVVVREKRERVEITWG